MKMRFANLFILFLIISSITALNIPLLIDKKNDSKLKISFGSCSKFDYDDPIEIFDAIKNYQPDLYAWLGKKKKRKKKLLITIKII